MKYDIDLHLHHIKGDLNIVADAITRPDKNKENKCIMSCLSSGIKAKTDLHKKDFWLLDTQIPKEHCHL